MAGKITWTRELDSRLRELHGTATADAIGALLGVSAAGVRNRASRLGITKPRVAKDPRMSKPGIQPMRFDAPREEYKGPLAALLRVWR